MPAGDSGIRLWDLPSISPIQTPDYEVDTQGQITAVKWSNWGSGPRLVVGTGLEIVFVWKFDAAEVT